MAQSLRDFRLLLLFLLLGLVPFGMAAPARAQTGDAASPQTSAAGLSPAAPSVDPGSEETRSIKADDAKSSRAEIRAPASLDFRLLIDVSEPLFRADPGNNRAVAIERLLQSLPENGRAGVWTYAREAGEVVPYGVSDVFWKRQAVVSVHALEAEGERSSVFEGLKSVTWDIGRPADSVRHIVIVTGGQDRDSSARKADERTIPAIFDVLATDLAASDMRVHVVVVSGAAGEAGLEHLAAATGGMHLVVQSLDALGAAFERVTQHTSQPPSIPVVDGTFRVDPGLREITLRIDGDDPRLSLRTPTGKTLNRATPGTGVRWHDATGFDAITIKHPKPGLWRINPEGKAEVTAWGDLALRVSHVPPQLFPGNLNPVDFMLFNGDQPVTDGHFLDMTRATARLSGQGDDIPLSVEEVQRGLYRVEMVSDIDLGQYILDVRLEGPTFARKASIPFEMAHPVKVHVAQRGKDVVAWLQLTDTGIDQGSLKVAARFRMPPNPRRLLPAKRMPGGLWQVTVPGAINAVEFAFSVFGRYQTQKKFELHTEALRIDVPLRQETVFGFDALGRPVRDRDPGELLLPDAKREDGRAERQVARSGPVEPLLPLWFAFLVAALIIAVAGSAVWLLMRKPVYPEFREWLASRPSVRAPEPEPQGAT